MCKPTLRVKRMKESVSVASVACRLDYLLERISKQTQL